MRISTDSAFLLPRSYLAMAKALVLFKPSEFYPLQPEKVNRSGDEI
jgi:hypothetical protein